MENRKISCPANLDELPRVTEFVEESADSFGLDVKKTFGLAVAVEEAFVNICNYAYPDRQGDVELLCMEQFSAFVMEIADMGDPFDVLSLPEPDITSDIMDRQIGGLGVYFIRQFSDEVNYRRENGRNILRLLIRPADDDLLEPETDAADRNHESGICKG